MANKFTKSVLERQQLEQKERRKAAEPKHPQPEIPKTPAMSAPAVPAAPAPTAPAQAAKTGEERQAAALPLEDLLAQVLSPNNQRLAKNKTFYLDVPVIERIKTISKQQQITESRLVNDILKKVLGV